MEYLPFWIQERFEETGLQNKQLWKLNIPDLQLLLSKEEFITRLNEEFQREIDDVIPKWVSQGNLEFLNEVQALRLRKIFGDVWQNTYLETIKKKHAVGSSRDGTSTKSSDVDIMGPYCGFSDKETKEMVVDIPDCPGFVVVELSKSTSPMHPEIIGIWEEINGKLYLSGKKMKEDVGLDLNKGKEHGDESFSTDSSNFTCSSVPVTIRAWGVETDITLSILCEGWPSVAEGWKSRERKWPDRETVESTLSSKYYLVPKVAQKCSICPDIQWRISFSFAEIILMDNIGDIALMCYRILKNIFKSNNLCDAEFFTTYHLKTAFFWICEEYPSDWWSHDRLPECIDTILEYLFQACALHMELPHYFIPEINLLEKAPVRTLHNLAADIYGVKKIVEINSWKEQCFCHHLETGLAEVFIAQRQAEMSHVLRSLTVDRYQLKFNALLAEIEYNISHEFRSVGNVALVACIHQHISPDIDKYVASIEYLLNCIYAAVSFGAESILSIFRKISTAWTDIFSVNSEAAIYFVDKYVDWWQNDKWVKNSSNPLDLSDSFSLVRNHDDLWDECMTFFNVQPNKRMKTFDRTLRETILNKEQTVESISKSLKPEDFIEQAILEKNEKSFVIPTESYLTIHDMANPEIWIKNITYEDMKQTVRENGHRPCSGTCFSACIDVNKINGTEEELGKHRRFHRVTCGNAKLLYADCDMIECDSLVTEGMVKSYSVVNGKSCKQCSNTKRDEK